MAKLQIVENISHLKVLRNCAAGLLLLVGCAGNPGAVAQTASAWQPRWLAAPWSTSLDGAIADGSQPMPVFRHRFQVRSQLTHVTLKISGLGQWQAALGQRGGVHPVMAPGLHGDWTDYRKTVTYESLDVTRLLRAGNAVLTVMLGNGMYNVQRTPLPMTKRGSRYTKFAASYGAPKFAAELTLRYADGSSQTIGDDLQWRAARGPVVYDSAFGGEDFDARRLPSHWQQPGFDDAAWTPVEDVAGPGGEAVPRIAPRVGQHEHYLPVRVTRLDDGRVVYDLGQNFAGIVHVRLRGPAGAVLRLTPGELLNSDGSVSQATFHGPMWWSYTLRGDRNGESWEPLFGYEGFRYVEAEWTPGPGMAPSHAGAGRLLSLEGIAQYSDAAVSGGFASSSDLLNRIHALIVHAMHNNEVSLLTDCPHREKLGWLEQTHLQAPGLMYNNDLASLLAATDRNMRDAQKPDGIVPTIAPQYTHFGLKNAVFDDSPEWGSASVLEPWWAYRFYGDRTVLEQNYAMMQRYVAALASRADHGVVLYGLGDWYDIGPGSPGMEKNTSLGVTATLMLYEDAHAMEQIATLLHHDSDAAGYRALAQQTAAAFHAHFWDAQHHWYDRGSQTANAMPLALGIVPAKDRAEVLAHLVDDIHAHQDHVTTGEVGYPYLLRALSAAGRDDVVLAMMLRRDPPSYGAQLATGATALTEAWDANPHSSQDHLMLGGAEAWFYRDLGGIDVDEWRDDPAERIRVWPRAVAGLQWVRCHYRSHSGMVRSDWRRSGDRVIYEITVPTQATVVLPSTAQMVAARGGRGKQPAGGIAQPVGLAVQPLGMTAQPLEGPTNDLVRFVVPAGTWRFTQPARP